MTTAGIKLCFSGVFFFSTLICALLPVCLYAWIRKRDQSNRSSISSSRYGVSCMSMKMFVSCITCFGGGVFLGVCLLDLLPDVVHHINITLKNEFNYDNEHGKNYPFGEMLVTLGFFLVLFVEQMILSFRTSTKSSISNGKLSLPTPHKDEAIVVGSDDNDQFSSMIIEDCSPKNERRISSSYTTYNTSSNITNLTVTRNFLMTLSLVIHSIFEGIAIGSLNDHQTIIQLSLAILVHKSIISLSIGLKLMSFTDNRLTYLACMIFASATPIGIWIMLSMQELLPNNRSTKITNDILRAFACGTFLYITFFDVLPHELEISSMSQRASCISRRHRLIKTFCVLIGFTFTTILLFATK